jgi:hypothetical protein
MMGGGITFAENALRGRTCGECGGGEGGTSVYLPASTVIGNFIGSFGSDRLAGSIVFAMGREMSAKVMAVTNKVTFFSKRVWVWRSGGQQS